MGQLVFEKIKRRTAEQFCQSDMKIDDYKGKNAINQMETERLKLLFSAAWENMRNCFGDNVDYERFHDEILYCEETRDYLYCSPPPTARYEMGTRPVLEEVVEGVTRGLSTDRERALALLSYTRDLKNKSGNRDYFYGGTEEELIKKGEKYCERLSRLMVALCEVA